MTASASINSADQPSAIAENTAENTTTALLETTAPDAQNSTNTIVLQQEDDKKDTADTIPTTSPAAPIPGDLDSSPIIPNPEASEKEHVPAAITESMDAKPSLIVDSSVIASEPSVTSPRPKGIPDPKTPRRLEGLVGFETTSDADSERRSGWRPVQRHATNTFAGSQLSDHGSFTARPGHVGNVPHSARPGTEMERTIYAMTLDKRERDLDRRERELDRREREQERNDRELERRKRDFEQDRMRWDTQIQMESYLQAVAQPNLSKPALSQDTFPVQWQTVLESFKKSLQSQILLDRQEAEAVLEARIMRRVNDELAKERKMQEVMQMSDKEVNELMEDTVGHWLRKDEDVADNIRFQSLLHLAQEKMAAVAGIQLLPDTDSWALSWRLAIGPSFITQERYNKAMDLLKDKEMDVAAKAVVESRPAMEFIVEWITHLRKDESFIPGRISREEYLESVRRQVDKLQLDEQAFVALVDFVAPN